MNEWKKVKLGDLTSVITKGTSPSNIGESFTNKGIRYIRSEMITQNKYISEHGSLYISKETHDKLKRSQLKAGDILFSMAGIYLGKTAIFRECDVPANTNQAVAIIRLNGDLCNKEYLYYFLNQEEVVRYVNQISGQAAQPNINLKQISNIEIDIPNKNIQYCIATILSRYDSLIENYQKQIKLLEESAQRLYKEWFIDLRFPGHENTKIVDGVPEGWEKKKVGDIVKIKSGFAFKSKDWQKQGCPVVKIKDISGVFVNTDSLDYVSSNVVLKAQQYLLNKMDLVIAMTGATIGKIGLITDNGLYANQRVGKFFLQNTIDVPYLYCFFKQAASIEQIVQISSASSAQPNISGGQLESLEILYNVNILKEFNLKCYKYFRQMIHLYSQILHLTEARDRLLPKLMSGEIEV